MFGKYFKIRSIMNKRVSRHYSIATVMQPSIYKQLVELLEVKRPSPMKRKKTLK